MSSSTMPFRLLDLTFELRLNIYEHLFRLPKTAILRPAELGVFVFYPPCRSPCGSPAVHQMFEPIRRTRKILRGLMSLMLASKQLNEETSTVLYGSNTFYFLDADYWYDCEVNPTNDFDRFHSWLVRIGPRNRSLIRNIELAFSGLKIPYSTHDLYPTGGSRHGMTTSAYRRIDSLINGLNTLAPGNHLRVLNLNLNATKKIVTAEDLHKPFARKGATIQHVCDLFRRSSSDFLDAISGLRGLQEFRCDMMELVRETDPDIWEAFRAFKAMMESHSARVVEVEVEDTKKDEENEQEQEKEKHEMKEI